MSEQLSIPVRWSRPFQARPRRAWWRLGWADLFGALAIGSVVVVLWMWLRTQGIASLSAVDSAIGSLGLLTGLLSADLMLIQVVMLARVPWIERAWSHDLLARRHKYFGYASFWLMVAHVLLFVVQRLGRDSANPLATIAQLFVLDSWMLWASIGTVMIIGVVVTSIQIARRRLRYESWHLIHLYAYLGMAFALPHMIADGSDFHAPIAQIYWWSIYGATLVALIVFRLGQPLLSCLRYGLRVESVGVETDDVVSIAIAGRGLDRLGTRSGQFFIWRFLAGAGWTRGNPYTISAAPRPDRLRVTIQAVGDGSARAALLKPGTRVLTEGPYGTMTDEHRTRPRMLLMAAGVGITPLRALLEDSAYAPGEATLLYRYTAERQRVLADELDQIAARRGAMVHYLPGPRKADGSWQQAGPGDLDDKEALLSLVPDARDRDVFLCGPAPWLAAVKSALRKAGVPARQIHSEDFAW